MWRAIRLITSGDDEWQTIGSEVPRVRAIITRFVLPLALIPAVSWSIGLLLSGNTPADAGDRAALEFEQIVRGGLVAYIGVVISILLCAVSIYILAPVLACARDLPRALQVAAYSAAPLLVGGLVLLLPALASILVLAFIHTLYLQYTGLQRVLAVKEGDAAEFVALSNMLFMILSAAIGALGARLGIY